MLKKKRNDININMFTERNCNECDSMFHVLLQSKTICHKTEEMLKNLQHILESREYKIVSLEGSLIKFTFHFRKSKCSRLDSKPDHNNIYKCQ